MEQRPQNAQSESPDHRAYRRPSAQSRFDHRELQHQRHAYGRDQRQRTGSRKVRRAAAAMLAGMAAISAAACAGRTPATERVRTPSPVGTMLIDAKGVTMPVDLATRTLTFTPFFPPGQILQAAVIPPLNVDQQRNHGLGLEYAR